MENITKAPETNTTYSWRYLFKLVLQYRKQLIAANLLAILATLVSVPIPLFIPLLVDEVLLDKPGRLIAFVQQWIPVSWHEPAYYIAIFTLFTIFLRLSWLGLIVWQTREFAIIGKDITFRIRQKLLSHLQTVSLHEYETLGSGTVASRFVVDMETIDHFISASVSRFIVGVLTLLGVTIVLLWIHWQLALFILLVNPIVVYFTLLMGKHVKQLKKRENKAFEVFQQALTETLDAMHQVRASNRETHFFSRLTGYARDIRTHASSFSWRSDAANRLSFLIFLIGFDLFRALGMLMVLLSDLSIGQMLAVFGYLWFMMGPVQEVLGIQYSWYSAKAALTRINKLAELSNEPSYPHLKNPFATQNTVSVTARNITFAYGDKAPVLKNISLHIPARNKIALVGASGGGKSTFVQVLLGLYQPQQGQLLFDDIPAEQIGLDVIRENVATVLQQPALFNDTVRNNLTLGAKASDERLWQALETAQLADTIRELKDGLDTLVGKQGIRLSGGQRQRLAVARMILGNPKVVILDEATSALDTETEEKLHKALNEFLLDKTTLIIAHRLSAVRQADHIFVFEDGHIIEQGAHDELVSKDGLYARLYGDIQSNASK